MRWRAYETGVADGKRERKPGAGQKGKLPTPGDKLLFVLYYYKTYPTFDVLGTQFNMARSKANENLHRLSPVLHETLARLGVLPHREFETPDELKAALQGIDQLLIDVTERIYRRSQDDATQRQHFSGKKKRHTVKNMIFSTLDKHVLFVGRTFTGRNHDYSMLKEEFPPDLPWFDECQVLVDLGFLGMSSDYQSHDIHLPFKKPHKSKNNPNPELSEDQKTVNKALSQLRIFVENAIGGMKNNILVDRFRNHKPDFEDDVIAICAGLWTSRSR